MKIESLFVEINQHKIGLSSYTTKSQLIKLLGEPDDVGSFSKNRKRGQILKYEDIEFHFKGEEENDTLTLIYEESKIKGKRVTTTSINFEEIS